MDEQKDEFTLTLKGKGINVENTIDQKMALTILSTIWGDAPATVQSVTPAARAAEPDRQRLSIGEYFDQAGASTNKERIVAIGLYAREFQGTDTFSKDDVKAGFRSAREPMPRNLTRDLATATEARWIEETEESGVYYVTNTGAKAFEGKFRDTESGGSTTKRTASTSRRKLRPKATEKGSGEDVSSEKGKEGKKKSKSAVGGRRKTVEDWILDGFFDEPKTIGDLQKRFHERAIIVPQTSLSPLLVRVVRDGLLKRTKQDVSGKQLWTYTRP